MNDDDIVTGRATARFVSDLVGGSKRRGDKIVTTLRIARHLVDIGVMKVDQAPATKPVGPAQNKPAGPSENKAPPVKKSCGARTDGRSLGSPSSSAPGQGIQSSSLQAVRVLRLATG